MPSWTSVSVILADGHGWGVAWIGLLLVFGVFAVATSRRANLAMRSALQVVNPGPTQRSSA